MFVRLLQVRREIIEQACSLPRGQVRQFFPDPLGEAFGANRCWISSGPVSAMSIVLSNRRRRLLKRCTMSMMPVRR